jgi:hypothetical protein
VADRPVFFFYFKHKDDRKNSMRGMLQSLLVQVIYHDDVLADYFHNKLSGVSPAELGSLSLLKQLFLEALESQPSCIVILDGLDECVEQSQGIRGTSSIVKWFHDSVLPSCNAKGCDIRLLLSGQRDGVLDKELSAYDAWNIHVDKAQRHRKDIHNYAVEMAKQISGRFSLDKETEAMIISKVTDGSKGVYAGYELQDDGLTLLIIMDIPLQACFSLLQLFWITSWSKDLRLSSSMKSMLISLTA